MHPAKNPSNPGESVQEIPRYIGTYRGESVGPTVLIIAAMHGNEPSGIKAFRRVLGRLQETQPSMRGELIGIIGNRAALAAGKRYMHTDFNRMWTNQQVDDLRSGAIPTDRSPEHAEQLDLLNTLEKIYAERRGNVFCIDVHTFSAAGMPFAALSDTLRVRKFAFEFPIPIILGLEEALDGTLLEYMNNAGHVAIAFEAGQHDDPISVDNHEAAIWVALVAGGALTRDQVPSYGECIERLERAGRGLPHIMEIRYRHAITEADEFRMNPGYSNFTPIDKGEKLAVDKNGDVLAREAGLMLMPLYQPQGTDGFFLGREVQAFWLHVSAIIRRLGFHRIVHWLPGVSRHPTWQGALTVDTDIARWYVTEIFHLLGYRRERPEGDHIVVSRRLGDVG